MCSFLLLLSLRLRAVVESAAIQLMMLQRLGSLVAASGRWWILRYYRSDGDGLLVLSSVEAAARCGDSVCCDTTDSGGATVKRY